MGLFRLARPSIEGTLAANFAHGPGHGLTGATVAWHVMALADSHKLLTVIRGTELPTDRSPEEASGPSRQRRSAPDSWRGYVLGHLPLASRHSAVTDSDSQICPFLADRVLIE